MMGQTDAEKLLRIVIVAVGFIAFTVGACGGWTLVKDYLERAEQRQVQR